MKTIFKTQQAADQAGMSKRQFLRYVAEVLPYKNVTRGKHINLFTLAEINTIVEAQKLKHEKAESVGQRANGLG